MVMELLFQAIQLSGNQHLSSSHEHGCEAYLWRKILRPCHSPPTNLHCLKIQDRITFKILLLVQKAAKVNASQYLTDLLTSASTIPGRLSLRSSGNSSIVLPRSRTVRHGDRSFQVSGPRIWNVLPCNIRLTQPLKQFKSKLRFKSKNLLISRAY